MTVDRSLYASSFDTLPDWPCPTCRKGHLRSTEGSILRNETGPSKKARAKSHSHSWEPEDTETRFAGLLTCDFGNCGELVAILGDVLVTEYVDHDEDGEVTQQYGDRFRPRSLSPAPLPIAPPVDTPELVTGALREAAGLLWQSTEGAANQVRQAVEHLMDEQGVTKAAPPAFKSLHSRIEEFKLTDETNAEILLAIKWLGNSGSHAGGLTRSDLFVAFDLIELALVNLYDTTTANLIAAARAINTNKGPVGPTA